MTLWVSCWSDFISYIVVSLLTRYNNNNMIKRSRMRREIFLNWKEEKIIFWMKLSRDLLRKSFDLNKFKMFNDEKWFENFLLTFLLVASFLVKYLLFLLHFLHFCKSYLARVSFIIAFNWYQTLYQAQPRSQL